MVNNVNHGCVIMLIMVNNIWLVVWNLGILWSIPTDVHSIIYEDGHVAPPTSIYVFLMFNKMG